MWSVPASGQFLFFAQYVGKYHLFGYRGFVTIKTSMKKYYFFAGFLVFVGVLFAGRHAEAAVGRNTCIIATCHASGKPVCMREQKMKGLMCTLQAEAADFCVSFIKCGVNKKGQCIVASDVAFNACKSCVLECLGEGQAMDAPLEQRIKCQQQCVEKVTPPSPPKKVSVKKTK